MKLNLSNLRFLRTRKSFIYQARAMTQNPDPSPDPSQVLDDLLCSQQQRDVQIEETVDAAPTSLSSPSRVLSIDTRVERAWAHWKSLGRPKYIVAPMVDNSELPFRLLCQKYGAQAAYTPMLHSRIFTETEKYRNQEFTTCKEDRPLFVQFCANDPNTLLEAAKRVEPYCDYVDINLGVSLSRPDGFLVAGGAGMLTAASLVQVVACSFVYGSAKAKAIKQENGSKEDNNNMETPTSEPQPQSATEPAAEAAAQTPLDFSGSGWAGSGGNNSTDSRNHNHLTELLGFEQNKGDPQFQKLYTF